ncbi:MAG TPA: pilus assembly protein TadG-related protein [Candidatus Obscuribacterales bacterium]
MKRKYAHVRARGSVAGIAFIALVPLVAAIGGFAVDCMHVNDAKGELQRAVDAAALAGAEDLSKYVPGTIPDSATSVASADQEPLKFALQVAELNAVDGPFGLWSSSNRSIKATIRYDSNFPGTANSPNRCDVSSQIYINSLFAKIFGNFGQNVSASGSAAYTGLNQINGDNGYLVVSSIDLNPAPNGSPLGNNPSFGTNYTVDLHTNSVWVSNPNVQDDDLLGHIWDPSKYPPVNLPPITIGSTITTDHGIKNAGTQFANLIGYTIVLVVTNQDTVPGSGKASYPVTGFIGLKVTGSTGKTNVTGTLVPLGIVGGGFTGGPTSNTGPFLVRLVQ